MIKMFLVFVVLFIISYACIEIYNKMNRQEKWDVAKTVSYSIAIALGVIAFMVCLVFLF
jgi:hypothetical protein